MSRGLVVISGASSGIGAACAKIFSDKERADNVYKGMTPLVAQDIAECAYFAASRPQHVNLDHIIVMPTEQASVNHVHRAE